MERLIAALCFGFAFVVAASVIVPGGSHAEDDHNPLGAHVDEASSHAHAPKEEHGLPSLGSIEDNTYRIEVFATEDGPRYTIIELETGHTEAELMSEEQVHQYYPDLQLPGMGDDPFDGALLMADDAHH